MLRELIDRGVLDDFAGGLARACGLRVTIFDDGGGAITRGDADGCACGHETDLDRLPRPLEIIPLAADAPPAGVAFVRTGLVCHVVAPIYVAEKIAGYVGIASVDDAPRTECPDHRNFKGEHSSAAPRVERSGTSLPVTTARWASRALARSCMQEMQLDSAMQELALIGDIGDLLAGERDLQTVLDQIVEQTSHVMNCRYCSLRLYHEESGELTIAAGFNLPESYLNKGRILRAENPIDDQALSGATVYIPDAQRDTRIRFPDEARRLGIISGLTTGLIYHGQPIGVIRVYSQRRRRFRTSNRHLLRAVASQAAIAIANARLVEQRLRDAAVERQLELAGDLQARMVSAAPPSCSSVETAIVYEPSSHVGGDFCDIFALDDGRIAACAGDVSGHGVPAALLMASVRGALRACAESTPRLDEIVRRLNRQVFRETATHEFVTFALLALDPRRRVMQICNAGHEPPLVLRGDEVVRPESAGLILGVDQDERYAVENMELSSGDLILLYTDGAIEANNFDHQMYSRERLVEALKLYGSLRVDQVLRSIHWDIRRFVGMAEQSDDLTLVGIRIGDDTAETP